MTIDAYYEKFEKAKANGNILYSDPHVISGYKLRLLVDLNGVGEGKGTHMSVFFQLMKGTFDDYLMWPFDKLIEFVLIHQDDQSKYVTAKVETDKFKETKSFQKPVNYCNKGLGYAKFVSLKELHDGGFIKGDILYIRCVVEL